MNRSEISSVRGQWQIFQTSFVFRSCWPPLRLRRGVHDCLSAVRCAGGELGQLAEMIVLDIGTTFHPAIETFTRQCDEMLIVVEPLLLTVKRTHDLISELKTHTYGSAKALTLVTVNRTRAEMTLSKSQNRRVAEPDRHPWAFHPSPSWPTWRSTGPRRCICSN